MERSRGETMLEDAPNVVTEDGLRQLLAQGYLAEVVCRTAAEKRLNAWYGSWYVRAIGPAGGDEKIVVTSRNYIRAREFKTVAGLVSFLSDIGMRTAHIPLDEGGRSLHQLPEPAPAQQG